MGLAVSSCFISQYHFMICLTGLDGSVGRWVIYVCVCMTGRSCRSVLLFSTPFLVLSFTYLCALPELLWCTFCILRFKKSDSIAMYKQRRRTALKIGCNSVCVSSRFLSSKHWSGASYRNFLFSERLTMAWVRKKDWPCEQRIFITTPWKWDGSIIYTLHQIKLARLD